MTVVLQRHHAATSPATAPRARPTPCTSPSSPAAGRRARPWSALGLVLVAACATAPTATPPTVASAGDEVASANANGTPPDEAPITGVAGRWILTHDGEDWVTLDLSFDGRALATAITWHPGGWTEFTSGEIKLSPDGRSLRIEADYDDFDSGVVIELTIAADRMTGTVFGPTYTTPSTVVATRLR